MVEQCMYCGKDFDNLNENVVSSSTRKHICLECALKIIDRLDDKLAKLGREIEVLKRYNVVNELLVKQKIYETLIMVRDGQNEMSN